MWGFLSLDEAESNGGEVQALKVLFSTRPAVFTGPREQLVLNSKHTHSQSVEYMSHILQILDTRPVDILTSPGF